MKENKKEKCIELLKKSYKDIASVAVMLIVITMVIVYFLELKGQDLNVPLNYAGGDDMSLFACARFTQDSLWNWGTDKLSAPDAYYYNATEIITGLHNSDVFFTKLFMTLTSGKVGLSVNLLYLSTFYFIAISSYIVLRALSVKQWVCAGGSAVYGTLAFIFMRGLGHYVLSCYYYIPFVILIAIWLYEDEQFLKLQKGFFKYRKNIAAIIMLFLISTAGIGYYQLFACFFFMVAVITASMRNKNWNYIKRGCIAIAGEVFFVVIAVIPEIYRMMQPGGSMQGRLRSMADCEIYALKIIQLFLPVDGHRIAPLENLIDAYSEYVPNVNENSTAYLGILGIIGFMFLIFWLFTNKTNESPLRKRLTVLADMNICAILFATMGGFGAIIYILGIEIMRSYNRISVFIAFFAIAAICMLISEFEDRIKKKSMKIVYMVGISLVFLFTIWEQNPRNGIDYEGFKISWYSDEHFVSDIEKIMDDNDCIFQLPYVEYPEGDAINKMNHFSHLLGYIHSDKLRWSFGASYGSETANWYEKTASLPVDQMITEIKKKGFDGVYVNRNGYEDGEWDKLESELSKYAVSTPIVSDDEALTFFKIQ